MRMRVADTSRRLGFVGFVLISAATGAAVLLLTRANPLSGALEAEGWSVTLPARVINDVGASGGRAVRFGQAADTDDPMPLGQTGSWQLSFYDEFDGTSLDTAKWRPNWLGSSDTAITTPINSGELSCYDPAQVSVGGGVLQLAAKRLNAPSASCRIRNGGNAEYASGMVYSKNSDFGNGYYEARIFIPGDGSRGYNFPAFWTNGSHCGGSCWAGDGEIDIVEVLGGGVLSWHYHWGASPNSRNAGGYPSLSRHDGWHVFGLKRESNRLTFCYDGNEVGAVTASVPSAPHYVILNHGISTQHGGSLSVPATIEVDYFRFWQ